MATLPTPANPDDGWLPEEDLGTPDDELIESLLGPDAPGSDGALPGANGIEGDGEGDDIDPETGEPEPIVEFHLEGVDQRERALPIRQGDLTRLLLAEPGMTPADSEHFVNLSKLLGATFHSEFYERLVDLKERYAPLDPDSDYVSLGEHSLGLRDDSDEEFLVPFETTLVQANYRALPLSVIEEAVAAPNEMGLTYIPNFTLFEHLKVYVRGFTKITREVRSLKTRMRKRKVTLDAYQRVVVILKFKPGPKLGPYVRDDVLYLRMYKDVPHVDMEMHLPEQGTKVRMRWIDKAQIASPIVMGIPTLVAKALFASVVSPVALGGLIVGPISAGVNSFFGYQRSRQKHLYEMIYRLYYLTLANNASVITRLIDSAEDEEYKEAMLAYFFLWRAGVDGDPAPWDVPRLDRHIEQYLENQTGVTIDFEVADALAKLLRLGLARRDELGRLHALPIEQALAVLDDQWDNTFRYS